MDQMGLQELREHPEQEVLQEQVELQEQVVIDL
jgi:hypothetical protein